MPFYKTTQNIFVDNEEHFDQNWLDSDKLIMPKKEEWTYDRELVITDIDLWEVLYEGNFGVYAAYSPHAEFYMIFPFYWMKGYEVETFYGKQAAGQCQDRCKELDIELPTHDYWLDDDQYEKLYKS